MASLLRIVRQMSNPVNFLNARKVIWHLQKSKIGSKLEYPKQFGHRKAPNVINQRLIQIFIQIVLRNVAARILNVSTNLFPTPLNTFKKSNSEELIPSFLCNPAWSSMSVAFLETGLHMANEFPLNLNNLVITNMMFKHQSLPVTSKIVEKSSQFVCRFPILCRSQTEFNKTQRVMRRVSRNVSPHQICGPRQLMPTRNSSRLHMC